MVTMFSTEMKIALTLCFFSFWYGREGGQRGIKIHPQQCFMNDSSPSVHGGAVEVEIGGRRADQVQHLAIIMMLMVVKMVNKSMTFIFVSN